MTETRPPESKASLLFRTFFALPIFLFLTVIFWELVLGAWLLSRWCYEQGWNGLGLSAKMTWMLLAGFTICLTIMMILGWLVALIRIIRGRN